MCFIMKPGTYALMPQNEQFVPFCIWFGQQLFCTALLIMYDALSLEQGAVTERKKIYSY
jgi:hypothetical protein